MVLVEIFRRKREETEESCPYVCTKEKSEKNKQEVNMTLVEETERSHLLLIDSICIFIEMRKRIT